MPQPEKQALKGKVLVKEEEEQVKVEEGKEEGGQREEGGQWEEGTPTVLLRPVVPTKQCSQTDPYLQVIVQDLCLLLELQCYKNKQFPITTLIKCTFEVVL